MRIRQISDLHLEFFFDAFNNLENIEAATTRINRFLPDMVDDESTILIVGGDLATVAKVERVLTFLALVLPRFRHVIYVLGNHEHYGSIQHDSLPIIKQAILDCFGEDVNLDVIGDIPEKFTIDDITFLCGTMWTDYGGQDASEIHRVIERSINDHQLIRVDEFTKVKVTDLRKIFINTISAFDHWLTNIEDNSKTVICTHHIPSFAGVSEKYLVGDRFAMMLTHAFASNLDDFIIKHQPAVWTFGHTHDRIRARVGKTALYCNPLGYPKESNIERGEFDPCFAFEV